MIARLVRIILGVLVPIVLIALIYVFVNLYINSTKESSGVFVLVFMGTAIYASIPTIIYSLSMEFYVNRKISNLHLTAVASGFFGLFVTLSVYFIASIILGSVTKAFENDQKTLVFGFIIGIIVGYMLKTLYNIYPPKNTLIKSEKT